MKVKFNLIVDEILANTIFVSGREVLQNKILKAYAAQKYSMFKNDGKLYISLEIQHVCVNTNRNLPPHKIDVSFLSLMTTGSNINNNENIIGKNLNFVEERECRRIVDTAHPLIQARLAPLGELAMRYFSRVLEMRVGDYRLIIEPQHNRYAIQYKKYRDKKLIFRYDILTLEMIYISDEGDNFYDSLYVQYNNNNNNNNNSNNDNNIKTCTNQNNRIWQGTTRPIPPTHDDIDSEDIDGEKEDMNETNILVGVASFLDGHDLCVKTTYLLDSTTNTVLYHRYHPNDHTQIFPFTLETEDLQHSDMGPALIINNEGVPISLPSSGSSIYWHASWRLEAQLPLAAHVGDQQVNEDSVPHHQSPSCMLSSIINTIPIYILPKLDGNNGILRFYHNHFVISCPQMLSTTHPHLIPQHILHSLIDFTFIVETDLYSLANSLIHHYRPVAIIDFATTDFNAAERMCILQVLRTHFRNNLAPYYVFFQGEAISSKPSPSIPLPTLLEEQLQDGEIYEVLLNNDRYIEKICRHRPDKSRANPLKTVNIILDIQKMEDVTPN
ncbi:hypothetical protein TCON_1724 [Astathelohania contejeani]|uniref:Uncharacterized protein n=1 Tax=Astathelohania contejeani TaxID=164912 RepID=A0ABQ7HY14_9MICR|nr:hypothetical protein TCON_1724 [Thelohania contejeani]